MLSPLERVPPGELPERMDDPACDAGRLRTALEALATTNRLFGGDHLVWWGVRRLLDGRAPGPLRILDVGCGAGDIPRRLEARLHAAGWRPRVVLADLHPTTLRIARESAASAPRSGAFRFVRLTASGLPFADGAFDLALSSLTLHHLERREAVRLLSELARVSSGRWLVADLRRSRLALGLVRVLASTLWRSEPLPRVDGPVSVRRAFTPSEVDALLDASGVPGRVVRAGPVRLLAAGRAA
jgi:ubiquinone/menaquinone biosynthesis C-methylase UbiE